MLNSAIWNGDAIKFNPADHPLKFQVLFNRWKQIVPFLRYVVLLRNALNSTQPSFRQAGRQQQQQQGEKVSSSPSMLPAKPSHMSYYREEPSIWTFFFARSPFGFGPLVRPAIERVQKCAQRRAACFYHSLCRFACCCSYYWIFGDIAWRLAW